MEYIVLTSSLTLLIWYFQVHSLILYQHTPIYFISFSSINIKYYVENMVDSRVRVQLGPSLVNHEKNTKRLNKWFRFI